MLRFIIILFSFLVTGNDELQTGIKYYNDRALVCKGLVADATNVDKAIQVFEKELAKDPNSEAAGFYYIQCLNFKGRFTAVSGDDKKTIFGKAVKKGNELIRLYPKSGRLRFALLTAIGSLGESSGIMKAAESGVLNQVLLHSKMLIQTDSMYNSGSGWKVLGILNYKTPSIPLVLTWPDKAYAKTLLQKALKYFPADLSNNYYYAECLLESGEKVQAKIYFQLVLKLPTRKELYLEDESMKVEAKKMLAKL